MHNSHIRCRCDVSSDIHRLTQIRRLSPDDIITPTISHTLQLTGNTNSVNYDKWMMENKGLYSDNLRTIAMEFLARGRGSYGMSYHGRKRRNLDDAFTQFKTKLIPHGFPHDSDAAIFQFYVKLRNRTTRIRRGSHETLHGRVTHGYRLKLPFEMCTSLWNDFTGACSKAGVPKKVVITTVTDWLQLESQTFQYI